MATVIVLQPLLVLGAGQDGESADGSDGTDGRWRIALHVDGR